MCAKLQRVGDKDWTATKNACSENVNVHITRPSLEHQSRATIIGRKLRCFVGT